jgi:hypothetical protein
MMCRGSVVGDAVSTFKILHLSKVTNAKLCILQVLGSILYPETSGQQLIFVPLTYVRQPLNWLTNKARITAASLESHKYDALHFTGPGFDSVPGNQWPAVNHCSCHCIPNNAGTVPYNRPGSRRPNLKFSAY